MRSRVPIFPPLSSTEGKYRLSKNKARCDFRLVSDTPFKVEVAPSTHHMLFVDRPVTWQRLQATADNAKAVRFVSIYDPWNRGDLQLSFTPDEADKATVTVQGSDISDTWEWETADGNLTASTLHGKRQGGFNVHVNAQTAAPPEK